MRRDSIQKLPYVATGILIAGAIIYAVLCGPATGRRGYPEINPFWLAMPWLWWPPILLSAVFDSKSRLRKRSLLVYAIFTAFINAGTVVMVVPNRYSLGNALFMTLIPYGPIHLLVTVALEPLTQLALRGVRTFHDPADSEKERRWPLLVAVYVVLVLALSIVFPFVYRDRSFALARHRGIERAHQDWEDGEAIWYFRRDDPELEAAFASGLGRYDSYTGLRTQIMHGGPASQVHCEAYRRVIEQKLKQHGPADMVKYLLTTNEVTDLAVTDRFKPIKSFPFVYGSARIQADGSFTTKHTSYGRGGRTARLMYQAVVPEKGNVLVVVVDDCVHTFDTNGTVLQEFNYIDIPLSTKEVNGQ